MSELLEYLTKNIFYIILNPAFCKAEKAILSLHNFGYPSDLFGLGIWVCTFIRSYIYQSQPAYPFDFLSAPNNWP